MKILIVGAGALGGYFGGRLLAAGRDVTFLVRPGRAKQIADAGGLAVKSPCGDLLLKNPPLVQAPALARQYDLIILACKATGLDACIRDMAPTVGKDTMIIPVLNGLRHIDALVAAFGKTAVLGGRAFIFATLAADGTVLHQDPGHVVEFGELAGGPSPRTEAALAVLSGAGFDARLNTDIMRGMWEKWVMIGTTGGATSLMRAAIGDIAKAGAGPFALALMRECAGIAEANGYRLGEEFLKRIETRMSDTGSTQAASIMKDMEKRHPIESDQIIGDFLARAPAGREGDYPLLKLIHLHMKAYEVRRAREGW